jgi:hypothetical protein
MTTDEAMDYLDRNNSGWDKMLEKGVKPRDYARELVKIAKGKFRK